MTLAEEGHRIRIEIARLGPEHRARRYPAELRTRILDWIERSKLAGVRERQCSDQLGIPQKRFATWREREQLDKPHTLVPVQVDPFPFGSGVSFVTPSGYRVDGISMEQAIALLRAFS